MIDVGNTRIKSGVVSGDQVSDLKFWSDPMDLAAAMPEDMKVIVGSVKYSKTQLLNMLGDGITVFETHMPIPMEIDYETPESLGTDRLAAAVGASFLYPDRPLLVIDAGSCITYDFVSENRTFHGGMIAPGLLMRIKSMHQQTANLPDLSESWKIHDRHEIGKSTVECMVSGAKNGMINEINGTIARFKEKYEALDVILTGGDQAFFETNIKAPIFVRPNLVLIGLNQILINNEEF